MDPNYLDFEQPIAELEAKIRELRLVGTDNELNISEEIQNLQGKSTKLTEKIYGQPELVADIPGSSSSAAPLYPRFPPAHLYGF
jgi:acetyl-CoA carboxylase alpha subunit